MPGTKINLLVVVNWPLGGIRTYMKYTYKYLPRDRFDITILAKKTIEEEALMKDAEELGARLVLIKSNNGKGLLFEIFKTLGRRKIHVIQSHGIFSAAYVYLANLFFRIPHVLTVHGIIEERLMGKGITSLLKRRFLTAIINSVTILYGVSHDIIEHFEHSLKISGRIKRVVIHNGIDIKSFETASDEMKSSFRKLYKIPDPIFLIGFFGRFMPQKGFDYLIEAIAILERRNKENQIQVLAVGSGDYLEEYKRKIIAKGLTGKFLFIPFQRDMIPVYKAVDVIVMPSVWEAYPLQPAEAFVLGIPIIASNCIGLREVIKETPAIIIPVKDPVALVEAIESVRLHPPAEFFHQFKKKALEKYDVRKTSDQLAALFESLYVR